MPPAATHVLFNNTEEGTCKERKTFSERSRQAFFFSPIWEARHSLGVHPNHALKEREKEF